MTDPLSLDLTGALLVAMPGMGDPLFERAVVFLCVHSSDGAMGLIVNKPAPDISLPLLLEQFEIAADAPVRDLPVHMGGPVEPSRGFVLHGSEYRSRLRTLRVGGHVAMTTTLDVLEDIAAGVGPRDALVTLGYAGWGPGQLEGEIARNGWLTVDATPELLFHTPDADKWRGALGLLGVDPPGLSGVAGRA